ncbi:MAG: sigma-70 family RNA polymerase sigma factor [Lachnospiraceae bacterium]|nr:sigma-70 family RNA polymerase sigma factor [Lachnospiraceae bacterium]
MTNEQLIDEIRAGDQDSTKLMELWDQNSSLIWKACRKYAGRIEEEDAKQECYFAFTDAVNKYDAAGGASFGTFLYNRCLWHLHRYIENCGDIIRIPVQRRQMIRSYQKFVRQWYQVKGEQPDAWTIKMSLGLSADQLDQLREDMQVLNIRSLDEPLTDDPEDGTAADLVRDEAADVEAAGIDPLFYEERRRAVWGAVDSLNPSEGEAIRMYYRHGLTYAQAAALSGVTSQRIQARLARGIRRLRTEKQYKELRGFIDLSPVYSMGIQGSNFNRTWTSSTERTALHMMEMEERWKREREEIEQLYEKNRREREEYERRKASRL